MNRILAALVALVAMGVSAYAQTPSTVRICNGTQPNCPLVGAANPLAVTGTFSATLGGFAPVTQGTPVAATTGGNTQTLPAGAVVVATNVGTTNAAYCKLGASSDTGAQYIAPNGGWFAYTVGAATQLTCVTSTSTTTVNTVGGAGLATGTGGGSGGGGGGGAITAASGSYASGALSSGSVASGAFASGSVSSGAVASGAVASGALAVGSGTDGWDVSTGITTATAATVGSVGSVNAKLRLMTSQLDTIATSVAGAIPAGTNAIGSLTAGSAIIGKLGIDQTTPGTTNLVAITSAQAGVGATAGAVPANAVYNGLNVGGNLVGQIGDPCQTVVKTYTPISITTATTTRIVAPAASKKTYICQLFLTSAAADNVGIVEGTGGTCGTGTAGVIGGTTAANGPNFAANGGFSLGQGGFAVMATAGTNVDLCLITSAATPLAGSIAWVQQ